MRILDIIAGYWIAAVVTSVVIPFQGYPRTILMALGVGFGMYVAGGLFSRTGSQRRNIVTPRDPAPRPNESDADMQ